MIKASVKTTTSTKDGVTKTRKRLVDLPGQKSSRSLGAALDHVLGVSEQLHLDAFKRSKSRGAK